MPRLRIGAYQQGRLELRQRRKQALAPRGGAFFARRQIMAFGIIAWEAESHGGDGDTRFIVECRTVDAHPFAQAIATGIVEG